MQITRKTGVITVFYHALILNITSFQISTPLPGISWSVLVTIARASFYLKYVLPSSALFEDKDFGF
jgi:hypothetical protein